MTLSARPTAGIGTEKIARIARSVRRFRVTIRRMSRHWTPSWLASRLSPGAKALGVTVLVGALVAAAAAPAQAAWWVPHLLRPPQIARTAPPDQSWLTDVPEKPGAHSKGKVAVFVFNGDDVYQPVRAAVVRAL